MDIKSSTIRNTSVTGSTLGYLSNATLALSEEVSHVQSLLNLGKVNQHQRAQFRRKLIAVNFAPIARELRKRGWSPHRIDRAITHFKYFLELVYLFPNQPLVPPRDVDEVWHLTILDTRFYWQICHELFGWLLHHRPSYAESNLNQEQLIIAFAQTHTLYRDYFGIDLSTYQPDDLGACNACSSDLSEPDKLPVVNSACNIPFSGCGWTAD